jgi:hypothetical protein
MDMERTVADTVSPFLACGLSLDPPKRTYEITLVRGPFSPFGPFTYWVKHHPASDGLLTCGDPIEFADASVDPGLVVAEDLERLGVGLGQVAGGAAPPLGAACADKGERSAASAVMAMTRTTLRSDIG